MNLNAMMQQAKKMQAEMEIKQKELDSKVFKVEKQGVELTMQGNRKIVSIKINEALVDPEDVETLEDMIIISFNEAMEIIDEAQEEMSPKSPGGGMPF